MATATETPRRYRYRFDDWRRDELLVLCPSTYPGGKSVLEAALREAPVSQPMQVMDQIDSLQVIDICKCGCASVDFLAVPSGEIARLVADAGGLMPNGERVDVLVFAYEGKISSLEVVGYTDTPTRLPPAWTIHG